jgi:hypothetical protein
MTAESTEPGLAENTEGNQPATMGVSHRAFKLTAEQVSEIRRLARAG